MLPRTYNESAAFPTPTAAEWRALVDDDLHGAPFERKLVTHTYEGLYVKPLYTWDDWPPQGEPADASGLPGLPPYTRGAAPAGRSAHGWDVRAEHAEPTPAEANRSILDDLAGGAASVHLRLDAAGRAGLDADDPDAASLVCVDGTSLSTVDDWRDTLRGVHADMITLSLEAGAAFIPAASMLLARLDELGVPDSQRRLAFNADPLAVLAREGTLPTPLEDSLRQAAYLAAYADRRLSAATSLRVGTAPYHHAGATATQDLAFSMATALEYLRVLTAAGLPIDRAAPQLLFSYAVGTHFFLAVAKLRAARTLWTRVVELCGGGPESRRMAAMHVRPSKRVWTARDPWVNILRQTAIVFAAAVGGADAISGLPYDAALGPPSDRARRLSRNTQLILLEEARLHRIADPAGGSWYIERLTRDLAEKAWVILQSIESRGGMAECLRSGWVHEQLDQSLTPRLKDIATRREPLTGVSEFAHVEEETPASASPDLAAARAQAALRCAKGRPALAVLAGVSRDGPPGHRMDSAVAAARAGATLGQLSRAVFSPGRDQIPEPIAVHPFAEAFEHLRDASDRYAEQCGDRPSVFLASLGSPAQHGPRTGYARGFFQAGGFRVLESDGYPDALAAADAYDPARAPFAVICGTDEQYERTAAELAQRLHAKGAREVILAGNPGERESQYRQAGIDRFIFVRCEVVRTLTDLLQLVGATP